MDVIYLDRLFGLNLLLDYCLMLASARVCGVVLRRWRYALAALIGALYAALMVLPGFGWLANGMMKLALGAAMAARSSVSTCSADTSSSVYLRILRRVRIASIASIKHASFNLFSII